jgi:HD-GYP domain-containing protein (c-di-GMP phosphodiesterase class II)
VNRPIVPDTHRDEAAPPGRPAADDRLRLSRGYAHIRASTSQSWDEAVQRVILPGERRQPWQREQLVALLRTDYHLAHVGSLETLLQSILRDAAAVLGAQRGSIALADESAGKLRVQAVVVLHRGAKHGESFSRTLALRSFLQGTSLLCQDVRDDDDLVAAQSVVAGGMSSILCALLRSPRRRLGVLHLDRGPFQEPFTEDDLYLADAIAARTSVGIESAQLVQQQQDQFLQTMLTLARTVDARDRYTGGHTRRVTDYALCLAEGLRLPAEELEQLRLGTPLHDIGKIGIPDVVLRKPDKLTPEEYELMKQHPVKGVAILEGLPSLRPALPIVRSHHERWDGRGYPDGLAGEQIARVARVVAVADVFDALTSDRPYRRGLPTDAAFAEIERCAGAQFDPACAQGLLALRAQIVDRLTYHRSHDDLPPQG